MTGLLERLKGLNIFVDIFNEKEFSNKEWDKIPVRDIEVDQTNLFKIPKYLETVSTFLRLVVHILWIFHPYQFNHFQSYHPSPQIFGPAFPSDRLRVI